MIMGISEKNILKCREQDVRRLCHYLEIENWNTDPIPKLIEELKWDGVVLSPVEPMAWGSNQWLIQKKLNNE